MLVQIIALWPNLALIWGSIVLHRLIKGNVKNLQVSDSGPLWPSCFPVEGYGAHHNMLLKCLTLCTPVAV